MILAEFEELKKGSATYTPSYTQQAVSGDGSRGDCGLPLRRSPVGLQAAGRSRAAKASTGGQGIVNPICVCVCAYSMVQTRLTAKVVT